MTLEDFDYFRQTRMRLEPRWRKSLRWLLCVALPIFAAGMILGAGLL